MSFKKNGGIIVENKNTEKKAIYIDMKNLDEYEKEIEKVKEMIRNKKKIRINFIFKGE